MKRYSRRHCQKIQIADPMKISNFNLDSLAILALLAIRFTLQNIQQNSSYMG